MNAFTEWMKKVGLTQHEVAEAWGVQDPAIWKINHIKERRLSDRNVLRVWFFTGGAVKLDPTRPRAFYPANPKDSDEHRGALKAIAAAAAKRERVRKADAAVRIARRKRDAELYARWQEVGNMSKVAREYYLTQQRVSQIVNREQMRRAGENSRA